MSFKQGIQRGGKRGKSVTQGTKRRRQARQQGRRSQANPRTGGFLGIEKKFLDSYNSATLILAPINCAGGEQDPESGCVGCLSAPATGDGPQSRDGRKITLDSIFITGAIHYSTINDAADVIAAPVVYVALVQDMQTNAATIVSENVFTNPSDTPMVNSKPLRNLENTTRYRVLDQVTLLPPVVVATTDGVSTTSAVPATQVPFTLSANLAGTIVTFNSGTTADVANVVDNSLHVIAFATSVNYTPFINYNSRMRFRG